jgi:thiol-disulfide isomerase/thioredoxin
MKVLKFGAVWCPGCIIMKPRWQEIEAENPWLQTEYYDFDQEKDVVAKYNVNEVLPTFVFLDKSGNELLRLNGEVDKDELVRTINQYKDK